MPSAAITSSADMQGGPAAARERLRAWAEVALALGETAQASFVRREISEALGITDASRADLYELFVKELPPFASVYLSDEGSIGGAARSAIAGFYHVLGVPAPSDPDHLSSLLALLYSVLMKEADLHEEVAARSDVRLASVERARSVLTGEHLLSWLPAYLIRAREIAPDGLSGWVSCAWDLASVLSNWDDGCAETDEGVGELASALADTAPEFVDWITTPSRSGLIIAPSDIAEVADALGLAPRAGRKRFVLEELITQAGWQGVRARLAGIASRQEMQFASRAEEFSSLRLWAAKARRAAELLS